MVEVFDIQKNIREGTDIIKRNTKTVKAQRELLLYNFSIKTDLFKKLFQITL